MRINSIKIKINNNAIILFVLLLPLFRPSCVTLYKNILQFYNIITFLAFCYLIIEYIIKKDYDFFSWIIISLESWVFLVTFFNKGARGEALYHLETIVILALIIKKYSNNIVMMTNVMMVHFECCIYINFITMLVCPSGFFDFSSKIYMSVGLETEYWFLGVANYFPRWFIPGLTIAWLYRYFNKKNVRCYLLTVIMLLSLLIKSSATCLVGFGVFLLFLLFPLIKKILRPKLIMLIAVVGVIYIVFMQKFDFLNPIIEGVLGKDMTFSNRLIIWKNAISAIANNPIQGYGIMNENEISRILGKFPSFVWEGATHCHDEILQIMFCGGIIGLFLYVMIFWKSLNSISKSWSMKEIQIVFCGCLAIFIMGITEITEYALLYIPLILGYWISYKKEIYNT